MFERLIRGPRVAPPLREREPGQGVEHVRAHVREARRQQNEKVGGSLIKPSGRDRIRDTDGYWCLDYMTAYLEYLGSDVDSGSCTARRTWVLGARAKFRECAAELAAAGRERAAQKWAWFADRFEESMLSVNPHRFDPSGRKLEFS